MISCMNSGSGKKYTQDLREKMDDEQQAENAPSKFELNLIRSLQFYYLALKEKNISKYTSYLRNKIQTSAHEHE